MKKASKPKRAVEMLAEYDFSRGIQGKYAKRYGQGRSVVLSADVAAVFPDSQAVNTALRKLIKTARPVRRKSSA